MSLSAIITTSPTPTNPDVEFMEKMLDSLTKLNSKISHYIITFDGYKINETPADHCNLKRATITTKQSQNYTLYKENVKKLFRKKLQFPDHDHSLNNSIKVIQIAKHFVTNIEHTRITHEGKILDFLSPLQNIGFALSVKQGLELVETEYVLVQQHDWSFVVDIPSEEIIAAMDENPEMQYVGFISRKSLEYSRRICEGRHLPKSPTSITNNIPFTKLFYWYDKSHIARASHYRSFVFNSGFFKIGDFIEDTMGHVQLDDVRKNGVTAHKKYGTFLFYPDEGKEIALVHLNGRRFMKDGDREKLMEQSRKMKALELVKED